MGERGWCSKRAGWGYCIELSYIVSSMSPLSFLTLKLLLISSVMPPAVCWLMFSSGGPYCQCTISPIVDLCGKFCYFA